MPAPACRRPGCRDAFGIDPWDSAAAIGGTARVLAKLKDRWSGTLMLIGQPAEETIGGASGMLKDGLFTRFPKPDFCLALHDSASLPAGAVRHGEARRRR